LDVSGPTDNLLDLLAGTRWKKSEAAKQPIA
jgi:hypothetical protein